MLIQHRVWPDLCFSTTFLVLLFFFFKFTFLFLMLRSIAGIGRSWRKIFEGIEEPAHPPAYLANLLAISPHLATLDSDGNCLDQTSLLHTSNPTPFTTIFSLPRFISTISLNFLVWSTALCRQFLRLDRTQEPLPVGGISNPNPQPSATRSNTKLFEVRIEFQATAAGLKNLRISAWCKFQETEGTKTIRDLPTPSHTISWARAHAHHRPRWQRSRGTISSPEIAHAGSLREFPRVQGGGMRICPGIDDRPGGLVWG